MLKINPRCIQAHIQLGFYLNKERKIEYLKDLLDKYPESYEICFELGTAFLIVPIKEATEFKLFTLSSIKPIFNICG